MSYYQRRQEELETSFAQYKIVFYIVMAVNITTLILNLVFFSWYVIVQALLCAVLIVQRIFTKKLHDKRVAKLVMDSLQEDKE